MTEHLSEIQLGRYRRYELDPEELRASDLHLSDCEECRHHLRQAVGAPVFRFPAVHATYEQLEGHVDGKLSDDENQFVLVHAASCAACRRELDDLIALAASLNTAAALDPVPSVRQKISSLWRLPTARLALAGLAAAAVIVAIVNPGNLIPGRSASTVPAVAQAPETSTAQPAGGRKSTARGFSSRTSRILSDGDLLIVQTEDGSFSGLESLPDNYRRLVAEALKGGRVPQVGSVALETVNDALQRFGNSNLIMGLVYAGAGRRAEAKLQLEALRRKNPDSPLALSLLESVSPDAQK